MYPRRARQEHSPKASKGENRGNTGKCYGSVHEHEAKPVGHSRSWIEMDPTDGATGDRTRSTAQDICQMTTGVCLSVLWLWGRSLC